MNDYHTNSHFSGKKMNKVSRRKILSTKAVLVNGLNSSPNEIKKKNKKK